MSIEGVLTEVSPSVRSILGYTVDEVVGKDITTYIPPKAMNIIRREIARKIAHPDETSLYEIPLRSRSGKIVTCEINSRIVRRNDSPLEVFGIIRDTTERRRMENAIRTNEKKYREIFENAVEGKFRTTPDGKILDANTSFARILGYSSPEELIREIPDISQVYLHPEDRKEFLRMLKRDGIIENMTLEFLDRGRICRWIRLNARQFWEEKEEIIEGSCTDITKEHLLERDLREKEEVYRLLADNITDVIWTADMDMNVSYMSPSIQRLRGFTAKEASTQQLHEVYIPESLRTLLSSRAQGMEQLRKGDSNGGVPQYLELGMYHRDGHVIWTETVISLIFNAAHQPIGVVGSIRDISARKQVERAHQESETRLREAQKLAQIGNWEMNDLTRIIICSDEAYRIFEVERSPTPPTYEAFLRYVHPEDREKIDQDLLPSLRENRAGEVLFRIVLPDGRLKHLHIRAEREDSPEGMPGKMIGTIQDITSRMILEEERTKLMSQIQRNIAELTILNDGIRNPLAIIETILEMEPEWGREEIAAQIARIDGMVTQLDRRWAESEKIFSYLQKHYGITR